MNVPDSLSFIRKPGTAIQIQNLKYAIWNSNAYLKSHTANLEFRIEYLEFQIANFKFGIWMAIPGFRMFSLLFKYMQYSVSVSLLWPNKNCNYLKKYLTVDEITVILLKMF